MTGQFFKDKDFAMYLGDGYHAIKKMRPDV